MLINEIVNTQALRAAGSLFGQGAVNRLAQRAGTAGIPQATTAPGFSINPQGQAARASAPLINQIAQSLNAGWSQALQQAMAQTSNRATGTRGVTSVKDIPRDQLERALTSQLNATLGKMSNGKIQDYEKISSIVDPQSYNGRGQQAADRAVRELKTAMGTILATDPEQAQQARLSKLWQTAAEKLYTISSLATFQADAARTQPQVQVSAGGQISIGGQTLDPANPKDAQVIAVLRGKGLI